jgi:hypothetical protein
MLYQVIAPCDEIVPSLFERMSMNLSIQETSADDKEFQSLLRLIAHRADHCNLDLNDSSAIKRFMDYDFSHCKALTRESQDCLELHSMLTLLFRLQASTSEDIGITGLRRLWQQLGEILARSQFRDAMQYGCN